MKTRVLGRSLLAGVLLVAGGTGLASDGARIALLAGRPSHPPGMHEFRAGMLLFQQCLTAVPGIRVEVHSNGWPRRQVEGRWVDDPAALEGVAAVILYADGGSGHPAIQGERMAVLDRLAAAGVGLGFAHYGVEVPKGDPGAAMHRWIGGYYEHQFSVNPMWKPEFTNLPEHPVTRGVKPFATHDEWYFNMRWVPGEVGVTPILVATPPDGVRKGPYVYPPGPYPHIVEASGRPETMMWVHERADGGRGFGFTGGHTHRHWGNPEQLKVFLNAILWVAGLEVPLEGATVAVSEDDLARNLDPK